MIRMFSSLSLMHYDIFRLFELVFACSDAKGKICHFNSIDFKIIMISGDIVCVKASIIRTVASGKAWPTCKDMGL